MSDNDLPSANPQTPDAVTPFDLEAQIKRRRQVMGTLMDTLKPWLLEFGNWICGGLIAFNFVIVPSLLLLAEDSPRPAILISILAIVCALPFNVSGLFVLRLIRDMKTVSIDSVMRQAFQDADVNKNNSNAILPSSDDEAQHKRRVDIGLRYSLRVVGLSAALTLIGLIAALWDVAWWLALIFVGAVIAIVMISVNVLGRLMRPDIDTETRKTMQAQYEQQRAAIRASRRSSEKAEQ